MKKTLKKLLAITLTVLMLMPFASLYGSALSLRAPSVRAVEFTDNWRAAFSIKEIMRYLREEAEYYFDEDDIKDMTDDEIYELIKQEIDYASPFEDFAFYTYKIPGVKISMSDGGEFITDDEGYIEYSEKYFIEFYYEIAFEDFSEAYESYSATVPVTVTVVVGAPKLFGGYDYEEYILKTEAPLIECFIKKMTYVSGRPQQMYVGAGNIDIEGMKYDVTYYDGTKKRVTIEKEIRTNEYYNSIDNYIYYSIDGIEVSAYDYFEDEDEDYEWGSDKNIPDKGIIELTFMDQTKVFAVKYADVFSPFEDITLDSYEYGKTGLESISYTITYRDGETQSFDKQFTFEDSDYYLQEVYGVDFIDGFDVDITDFPMIEDVDDYESVYVCVSVAELEDFEKVEGLNNDSFFVRILRAIVDVIARIFSIFQR